MCETLLLANPDSKTLRPVRSRARTSGKETRTASRVFAAVVLRGLAISLHCYLPGQALCILQIHFSEV